jgi:lauroyl/myristoyl acyltransferase
MMLGERLPVQVIRKLFDGLGRKMLPFGEQRRLMLLNMLRCETHREALELLLSAEANRGEKNQG